MKTGIQVANFLREKHPNMRAPPMRNPTCAAFEEYEEVSEMVPFEFSEYDATWVASKLLGAAGAMGAEATDLRNWILRFGCVSEKFIVIVANLDDWVAN